MRTRSVIASVAAAVLPTIVVTAGSFTSDFSDPWQLGYTLNGTAYVEEGHCALTYAQNSQQGTIILDDLDGGWPIESFTAKFKLKIGPGSGNPADGVSFCFGPDVTSYSNFGEEGTGNGLIICFDIYDNGGGEAPAVEVKYGGASIAITKFAKSDMVTSKYEDVEVKLYRNGTLDLTYKGQKLCQGLILPNFEPMAGQFGFGGRTGGENAEQFIDDLSITTVVAETPAQPVVTTQPQSQTVDEGAPVTFTIGFDGSAPLAFQWYSNNVAITDATSYTYSIARVPLSANGAKYKCTVSNASGTATSAEATLTVVADVTPPVLLSAKGSTDFLGAVLNFSEPIDPVSGGNKANYSISGLTVESATVLGSSVVLVTSKQAEGANYTVVVNNVKDTAAAGNAVAPNSQASFRTFMFATGRVLHKKYNNIDDGTGGNPANLFSDPRFPNQPDRVDLMTAFEYPANGVTRDSVADPVRNYFDTLEGFFIPPVTGNYVFFTAGADRWWLYLSTDDDPANKYLIAAEPGGWTDPRGWTTTHDQDPARHRSDYSQFNEWPFGTTITLEKGKRYYMLMVHHDPSWCGGDWFAATYKLENEDDPAAGSAPLLTGDVVGCYIDPTGSEVTITQHPTDVTKTEGSSAKFTVVATGTSAYGVALAYQWQKAPPGSSNFTDIPGANSSSYETPILTLADNGYKYRVVCSVPGITEFSTAATLTVVPDTFPPKLVSAGSVLKGGAIEIGIEFDEDVDQTTASNVANYSLSKGSVTGVRYQQYAHWDGAPKMVLGTAGPFTGCAVVLTTSGLAGGDTVTVTVKNIKDLKGNAMSAAGESKSVKVTSKMKWAAMGGDDYVEGNTAGMNIDPNPALWPDDVVAVGDADFFLISSGTANWNNYDEATFVYEEVTGDFDKVARIEYQDPTSQWARAGMCATPSADEGMNRAAVEGGTDQMERRFLMRANPAVQWNGAAGNNAYEAVWRPTKGGNYSGSGAGTPAYPTAWLRMKREGQLFRAFYSNDGVNWTEYGSTTFTEEPMPDLLLVGMYYSPEFNNNSTGEGIGHSTVAKFRNYGNYPPTPPQPPALAVGLDAQGKVVITFEGTLQAADEVTGAYTDVVGTSPLTVTPTGAKKFYRARW